MCEKFLIFIQSVLMVEYCQRTQKVLLRPVSADNFENFNSLRQDLLRTLFEHSQLNGNKVNTDQLQHQYEHLWVQKYWKICYFHTVSMKFEIFFNIFFSSRTKFDSTRFAKTNGLSFHQVANRALQDFIESNEMNSFSMNQKFFEAKKVWALVLEEENRYRDRRITDKRLPIYVSWVKIL